MFTLQQFQDSFRDKLLNTRRWEGFSKVAEILQGREVFTAIEVGCMRLEDNWEGDGQSTLVWSWMAERNKFRKVVSVDIDEAHLALVRKHCPIVTPVCSKGEDYLLNADVGNISMLFLDGMDFTGSHAYKCWQSHLNMLLNCYDRLPPGCLIVMDDCENDNIGKHIMVQAFFDKIGVRPILKSYMNLWIKP